MVPSVEWLFVYTSPLPVYSIWVYTGLALCIAGKSIFLYRAVAVAIYSCWLCTGLALCIDSFKYEMYKNCKIHQFNIKIHSYKLHQITGMGILWNAESCQGVTCGKSSAERSANYPLPLFRIPQPKNSAFSQIARLPFARIAQQMCNRCIAASRGPFVPYSLWSIYGLPKNRVVCYNFD